MMKILYMTQLYPPLVYGGGEYVFAKWAQELTRRGHDVSVITQKTVGTQSFEKLDGVDVYRVGPEILYKGALYNIGIAKNLGFIVNAIRTAHRSAPDFDILHSNTYMPSIAGEIVAHRQGRPHVMTVHDVFTGQRSAFSKQWKNRNELSPTVKLAGSLVEKFVLSLNVEKVHTVSDTSRNDLIKAGIPSARIAVIPNGIDPVEYRSPAAKIPHLISYVGRLVFYKNLDTVIKAFRKVCDSIPQARMVIAGRGPFEKDLKMLADELSLQSNVVFAGQISNEEKVRLFTQSQLTVQPSIMEGFGITIIESFCCGTPVIASNVPPLPELVHDGVNGATLDPFCVEAWAKTLCHYLENPGICVSQGQAGRRIAAENYTITEAVDLLERLYHQVISGHP